MKKKTQRQIEAEIKVSLMLASVAEKGTEVATGGSNE